MNILITNFRNYCKQIYRKNWFTYFQISCM